MASGLFIAGTDTGVGKTYVACQFIRQLRNEKANVIGMKPVASGMREVDGCWINEDVEQIWQASGGQVDRALINQFAFVPFVAPHLAAAAAGRVISIEKIRSAYEKLSGNAQQVIVEGAGGLMTPLNETETFVDLVQQLRLGVVLVVAIRLGCINHALLTQRVLQAEGIDFVGWVANYPDPQQARDRQLEDGLKTRLDAPLLGVVPCCSLTQKHTKFDFSQIK